MTLHSTSASPPWWSGSFLTTRPGYAARQMPSPPRLRLAAQTPFMAVETATGPIAESTTVSPFLVAIEMLSPSPFGLVFAETRITASLSAIAAIVTPGGLALSW